MEITFKDTLKRMRLERGITQEALAKHLFISPQSVGKWERGEGHPDISLLPKIALFFDTTIDRLLGLEEERIKERIEKYNIESKQYLSVGKTLENYELWKSAYNDFPNKQEVKIPYLYALYERYFQSNDESLKKEILPIILRLGNELLSSADIYARTSAIQVLCFTYYRKRDIEKAKEYANMAGDLYVSREQLLGLILQGEEGEKKRQENSFALLHLLIENLESRASRSKRIDSDGKIKVYNACISIIEAIYINGDFGFNYTYLAKLYFCLAKEYAYLKNEKMCIECVTEMAYMAIMFDTLKDMKHTSILVDLLDFKWEYVSSSNQENCCLIYLQNLDDEIFNFIRDNDKFCESYSSLKKYAKLKS
ncbi:MAG: helix-turn-helix transcriptional regulator [Clostridia bacterium]|nr:helix-turn-helix transcriptional regulator [Clostridia bacterium]